MADDFIGSERIIPLEKAIQHFSDLKNICVYDIDYISEELAKEMYLTTYKWKNAIKRVKLNNEYNS